MPRTNRLSVLWARYRKRRCCRPQPQRSLLPSWLLSAPGPACGAGRGLVLCASRPMLLEARSVSVGFCARSGVGGRPRLSRAPPSERRACCTSALAGGSASRAAAWPVRRLLCTPQRRGLRAPAVGWHVRAVSAAPRRSKQAPRAAPQRCARESQPFTCTGRVCKRNGGRRAQGAHKAASPGAWCRRGHSVPTRTLRARSARHGARLRGTFPFRFRTRLHPRSPARCAVARAALRVVQAACR